VSVCRLAEQGRPKCHKYWPEGDTDSDPTFKGLMKKGYKVKTVEEKPVGETLCIRSFEVSSEADGGKVQRVT
jgi:hypothetical protein